MKTGTLLICLVAVLPRCSLGRISVPRLDGQCHLRRGDLNIGLLFSARGEGTEMLCSDGLFVPVALQLVESFKFAVEEINARQDVLPNITLGYAILDVCMDDLTALARSLYFMPNAQNSGLNSSEVDSEGTGFECSDELQYFNVFGIVGPHSSAQSVLVASLMSLFEIPVLGTHATSDELSDKSRFEFFMRLVPPDRFAAEGIVDFLLNYNMTYISLVYTDDPYGGNGAKQIESWTKKYGICIGYTAKIPTDAQQETYDSIAQHLIDNYKARAVVVFLTSPFLASRFFQAVDSFEIDSRYFVWIGGDSIVNFDLGSAANGLISFRYALGVHDTFFEHYKYLTPRNSSGNPWYPLLWKSLYDCEWDHGIGNRSSCYTYENTPKTDQVATEWMAKEIEGAWVYAYALDSLIRAECPEAFQDKGALHSCVSGRKLLPYMRNVTFEGVSGRITFDENGDMTGEFDVYQYEHLPDGTGVHQKVGRWDKKSHELSMDESALSWNVKTSLFDETALNEPPESVCSKPCKKRQYKMQQELACCWQCLYCRNNEYIVNGTGCDTCDSLTWPDDENGTTCIEIEPTFMRTSSPIAIGLLVISCIGIIVSVLVVCIYCKNRHVKLIKASGKELSAIVMSGILMAYLAVFAFVAKPTDSACYASFIGFNLSVTLIFGTVLLKTSRVYRIFDSGKRGMKKIRFVGTSFLIGCVAVVVVVQVGGNVFCEFLFSFHFRKTSYGTYIVPCDSIIWEFLLKGRDSFKSWRHKR